MSEKELRVQKIKNGTVIDHISAGNALAVLRILGISGREGNVVSVLVNVPSKRIGRKDIVKIEGGVVTPIEVDEIALVAPTATINIIRNFVVEKKENVKLPDMVKEILKCPNPSCITKSPEPVKSVFHVERRAPLLLRCYYCGTLLETEGILKQF